MTHEEIKILISAYIDGEATPSEKNIVEEHLKTCPSCQKDYSMYGAISSSLSKWTNETLSPDEEIKIQKSFEQRREPMFTKRTLMTLGTTLALTIIIGSTVQVYLKKGAQGNLRTAADNIGNQYSDANTSRARAAGLEASIYAPRMAMNKAINYNASMASMAMMANRGLPVPMGQALKTGYGLQQASNYGSFAPDRKIIKNAEVTLKVKNAEKTQTDLEDLVVQYKGTIINLNVNKLDDGTRRGFLAFNVFPKDFDRVLFELRGLGEVVSENQAGNDITNQYTYLQNQLDNYTSVREHLQKLLKKNMNDVDNNLNIQTQITNAENTIASLEGNIKDLDLQSYMSTITVNFYDTVETAQLKKLTFKEKITTAFKDNIKTTLETCYAIGINSFSGIIIILSFLAQIGLWSLLFWGIYLIVRKAFKK